MKSNMTASNFAKLGIFCCLAGMQTSCSTYLGGADYGEGMKRALQQESTHYPLYATVANQIPAVQKSTGDARVFFYHINPLNTSYNVIFYSISIDGQTDAKGIGYILSGSGSHCLFVDHIAGSCKVTVDTGANLMGVDPPKELILNLVSGETRYVQIEEEGAVSPTKRLILMEDPDQAVKDLNQCFYVGSEAAGVPKE